MKLMPRNGQHDDLQQDTAHPIVSSNIHRASHLENKIIGIFA